jgi:hypothetical protein
VEASKAKKAAARRPVYILAQFPFSLFFFFLSSNLIFFLAVTIVKKVPSRRTTAYSAMNTTKKAILMMQIVIGVTDVRYQNARRSADWFDFLLDWLHFLPWSAKASWPIDLRSDRLRVSVGSVPV